MEKHRPRGISFLGYLYRALGALILIDVLLLGITSGPMGQRLGFKLLLFLLTLFTILGTTILATGIGLLKLKKWAWVLAICLNIAVIIFDLSRIFLVRHINILIVIALIRPAIAIFVIWYLEKKSVKDAFIA